MVCDRRKLASRRRDDYYRDLTESLKARGRKVALDTSGETLNHAIEAIPTFIKPNIHELEGLVGRALSSRDEVVSRGQGIACTRDRNGRRFDGTRRRMFCGCRGDSFRHPSEVEVRSTVGAGDAMVAGVISAKLRELALAEIARLSTAFSVRAIGKLEGDVSVEALSQKVKVER